MFTEKIMFIMYFIYCNLLSISEVNYNIRNKDIDPTIKYVQGNTTFLIIKSWSLVEKNKYMVRFSINETGVVKILITMR
jgi:type IV secretory pathway component VirB8